jgi:hypothetical protein
MRNKMMWAGICVGIVIGLLLATAGVALAGSLNPSVGPTGAASQMYTLEQIYTRLTGGGNATKMTTFTEPVAGPGTGTMHTLDDIYNLAWPARVPKTGQTTSYATGDDGDLEKGVAWPSPRFTDNGDGTVTDNLTGLIWLKDANCFSTKTWANALTSANTLNSGECGLTDGSAEGNWRLPNIRELMSLLDYGRLDPALPSLHPFSGVQLSSYWTSTMTASGSPNYAWLVGLRYGSLETYHKDNSYYVWPVRGGTP